MLKRNKKIAQICALAMCINLIQGSFVKGYANETETNNDVSEVESSVNLEADDKSENEADNIESEANEADNIESEATDDILSNEENLEDIVDDEVIDETKSETIDEEEYEEVEETDSYNSSSDMVIINFNQYEKLSDNTLRLINGRDGIRGNIEIPESAEIDGETYTVTEIGERAFFGVCDLETVKLPSSVTKIGKNAFTACQLLREVSGLEGVVDIDKEAFNLCSSLKDISSLKNVRHIGEHAFYGCTSLEAIPSLENLESMDYGTFENCTSLKNIELGNKITYMPEKALSDTDSISVYTIPASVESIEKNSFGTDTTSKKFIAGSEAVKNLLINIGINSSCIKLENYSWNSNNQCSIDGLTYAVNGSDTVYVSNCEENTYEEITIPKTITVDNKEYTVTEVGRNAFYQKNNIKKVTLPETIKKIGNYAFGYCSQLTYVNLDDVDYIESSAFSYCSQLSNINIENATFIGSGAFHSCDNLDKIKVGNKENTTLDSPLCIDGKNLSFVSVGKGVSEIGWNSFEFKGNDGLCILSENIKKIDHGAFYISYGSKVKFIVGSEEVKNLLINSGVEESRNISIEVMEFDKYMDSEKEIPKEDLENETEELSWQQLNLDSIHYIPGEQHYCYSPSTGVSYRKLDDNSVEITLIEGVRNNEKDELYIPETIKVEGKNYNVTSIGKSVIPYCNYKKVVFPNSINHIEDEAFDSLSDVEELILPDEVSDLGIGQFIFGSSDLKKLKLPKNLNMIRSGFLDMGAHIPDIIMSENIKKISDWCFNGRMTNSKILELPDGIEEIGVRCFGIDAEFLKLPANLKKLGEGSFQCLNIEKLELPEYLQEIKDGCFSFCENLKEIKFGSSLKSIGITETDIYYNPCAAFSQNNSLEKIELPDSLEVIDNYAFSHNKNLKEVKLSNNLKKLGEGVFSNCPELKNIDIPESVEEIEKNAFDGCPDLIFNVKSERVKNLLLNCNTGIDESRINVI